MKKTTAELNREMAEALMGDGMDRTVERRQPAPHPEVTLCRQIEATKRQGLDTGQDVKPRLLELRMRHRDLTGEDGG